MEEEDLGECADAEGATCRGAASRTGRSRVKARRSEERARPRRPSTTEGRANDSGGDNVRQSVEEERRAGVDASGQAIHKLNFDKKRRRDLVLKSSDPHSDDIVRSISGICIPEMKKAFQYEARNLDRVLIARYDETGGFFRRHRDNTAPSVASRPNSRSRSTTWCRTTRTCCTSSRRSPRSP